MCAIKWLNVRASPKTNRLAVCVHAEIEAKQAHDDSETEQKNKM